MARTLEYLMSKPHRDQLPMNAQPLYATPLLAQGPDRDDEVLMAGMGIVFRDGAYQVAGRRYERLLDAVNHARLTAGRPLPLQAPGPGS
jgi:hypothetical protein